MTPEVLVSRPKLDRVLRFDPRSRAHLIRDVPALAGAAVRTRLWPTPVTLDQGREGACVGFAWEQWWATVGPDAQANAAEAIALYHEAQADDETPGTNYVGSSTLGGVRASQARGRVASYTWATSARDVAVAISNVGPVVLGIDWMPSMFDPAKGTGLLRVPRTSADAAGGHDTLLNGYHARRRAFRLHNSWGPSWGLDGEAWLRAVDLDYLLRVRKGDACLAIKAAA